MRQAWLCKAATGHRHRSVCDDDEIESWHVDEGVIGHEGFEMKRCQILLICMLVMTGVGAQAFDTVVAPSTAVPAKVSNKPAAQKVTHGQKERKATQVKLSDLKAGVVKDMRDTSAFVEEQASDSQLPSRWLIGLAAVLLVMLQLRRKHKSLPQQRIFPYG
jgi:hypothetical protein